MPRVDSSVNNRDSHAGSSTVTPGIRGIDKAQIPEAGFVSGRMRAGDIRGLQEVAEIESVSLDSIQYVLNG